MNPLSKITTIVAVAMTCAFASAESIDLSYNGIVGGGSAERARINSSTYYAGHMSHTITSGPRAGETFSTFCIELEEYAQGGSATYQIIDLADAPDPGTPYGQAKADAVSAVIANAYALGWIDSMMQANTSSSNYLARMGAIQAAVWEALGHNFNPSSGSTSSGLQTQYNILMNVATFDDQARMAGLRAAVAVGQQDQLFIVPLPTGAYAGFALLGTIGGVRTVRRRRA